METVWQNRRTCISLCKGCPGCDSPYPLGGLGDPDSDLMVVAKEPAYRLDRDTVRERAEDLSWGKAKRAMEQDRLISMNALQRQLTLVAEAAGIGSSTNLYFTNLSKCNDKPESSDWQERYDNCRGYFEKELEMVSPEIVLLYGGAVIGAVFEMHGLGFQSGVKDIHAQPRRVSGRTLVPLIHWGRPHKPYASYDVVRHRREVFEVVREVCTAQMPDRPNT